jgi:hypothetical protein
MTYAADTKARVVASTGLVHNRIRTGIASHNAAARIRRHVRRLTLAIGL